MAGVVTVAGQISCADQGNPTLTSGAKLTVSGKGVLLYSAVPQLTPWTGCSFTTPSGAPKPCTKATPVAQGQAGKLTAGSQPVLLDNLTAQTDNGSSVTVTAGQQTLTAPDAQLRQRRQLGVGIRADLVSPADLARDIAFANGTNGVDLALVEGTDNLNQCLAVGLTTLRGSDVFNQQFGFLGLTPLTQQSSPVLAREGLRSAVAEFLAGDPRVQRIVDLQVGNPMAAPSGTGRRTLDVHVAFEVITGDTATIGVGGLASGADWGALPLPGQPDDGTGTGEQT